MNNEFQEKIDAAVIEAKRFLQRVEEREALPVHTKHFDAHTSDSGETHPAWSYDYREREGYANGAIKRASLDLSRALAKLRH